jgi:outer membrane receptor for ferrienterochelin and colicin
MKQFEQADKIINVFLKIITRRFIFVLSAIYILLTGSFAFAGNTGKISGKVINSQTGEGIPFVNIIVEGTSFGAASSIDGDFYIIGIQPGTYNIKASAIGYSSQTIKGISVSIDLTTKVEFKISESNVELKNEIVIEATRPPVTKDLTASTAIISSKDISVLPITEFQEILQLKAGIVGGNVRGGRSGEVVYAIDGVPVTDVYDGSTVVDVNANSIQELQFVSGAFNAEYGKALSGYVNIATKEGDDKFRGSFTAYAGDNLSNHTDIFKYIDHFNPLNTRDVEGNLSGPIYKDVASFYLNGRYYYNDGWLKGKKVYNPWDITINQGSTVPIESKYIIQKTGDGSIVPMNYDEKIALQGKLTLKPSSAVKINYNFLLDKERYKDYDQSFSLDPDGDYKKSSYGNTNILSLTHILNSRTFYQASLSYFFKQYRQFVYESASDARWTNSELLTQEPSDVPSFRTGGTQNEIFRRTTGTTGFKLDFTSQVTESHLVKAGIDVNLHQLTYNDINLLQDDNLSNPQTTLQPFVHMRIPDKNDSNENLSIDSYTRKPIEFSAYIQDKIELKELIINIGLRYDFFHPDGQILTDPSDPDIYRPRKESNIAKTLDERRTYWYKKPSDKSQLSPRLGVAFPITDRGVIHFSYGYFFQIPNFEYLYQNQEYKFGAGTGNLGIVGNPDLKPEQTVNGEVGIQQALTDDICVDLTGYFRDIRNLTGTRTDEILFFDQTESYSQYKNSDFGFVKGIVFTLTKRISSNWSATIDYTLQSAKGDASDPAQIRNQIASGQRPEQQLIRLNSDQTHTLNLTFSYASPDKWGFSVIGTYGSGFPYTPTESIDISTLLTNSEIKPATYNVDLKAYKDFYFDTYRLMLFLRIYNLFDITNQINVYNDSGRADFTLEEYNYKSKNLPALVNSISDYYTNPTYYSRPRRFEAGFTFYFNE